LSKGAPTSLAVGDAGDHGSPASILYVWFSAVDASPRLSNLRVHDTVLIQKPMKLTNFTDFGLRALILLADRKGEVLSAATIADHFNVSRHHMAKVLQELSAAGYVEGIRGAQGGVRLARDPRDIRIGDVVRRLDKDQALVDCFRNGWTDCALLPRCRLKGMLARAKQGFLRELDRFTISDCLEKNGAARAHDLAD
jgi:Rrf2 family nitric oxide-sensitive transcriptional repressor